MITIEKISPVSGKLNSMTLPLTEEQYQEGCFRHMSGGLIQNCFPTLNPDQREFILTGITPEEWDNIFPEE